MTPRERLLAPLRKQKPDRPAFAADLTYWHGAAKIKNQLDPKYDGVDGLKKLQEELGVCGYYGHGARVFKQIDGIEVSTPVNNSEEIQRKWKTSKGELTAKWVYSETSYCWAHVEYAVKDVKDLAIVREIVSKRRVEPHYQDWQKMSELLGDSGVPISPLPRSPLPTLLTDWCGIVNTIFLAEDYPDEVQETLNAIEQSNLEAFSIACASPAELFHFCDNLDSSASASLFDYMGDYYKRRIELLHRNNKLCVVHLDGMVKGLFPKLSSCGFDGIEAITPQPVGDVEIDELLDMTENSDTVIWGGIPGAMFCEPWTEEAIKEQTLLVLKTLGKKGRLIVGTADQIPPDGNINYCRIIAETIESAPDSWF